MATPDWVPFKNTSGETIPARAVMKVTGSERKGTRHILLVDKPDGNGEHTFNGHLAIPANGFGRCCNRFAVLASYSGTPSVGDNWGPVSGSWSIQSGGSGVKIVGTPDADGNIVEVWMGPSASVLGMAVVRGTCPAAEFAQLGTDQLIKPGEQAAVGSTPSNYTVGAVVVDSGGFTVDDKVLNLRNMSMTAFEVDPAQSPDGIASIGVIEDDNFVVGWPDFQAIPGYLKGTDANTEQQVIRHMGGREDWEATVLVDCP